MGFAVKFDFVAVVVERTDLGVDGGDDGNGCDGAG